MSCCENRFSIHATSAVARLKPSCNAAYCPFRRVSIHSPDDTFAPDVAYISKARQPQLPETGFTPLPPDLAVEVKPPADSKRELRRKAEIYLAHGTRMVWLVFPQERRVEVYMPDADVIELGPDDTLDSGAALPGFALAVSAIFPA